MARRSPTHAGPLARLLSLEQRHSHLTFREIRDRVVRGDPEGWRLFVERYSRLVYSIALRLAGPEDREEIAQQVYLGLFERLSRDDCRLLREFRQDARFETYLFGAVRHEVIHLRKRRRQEQTRVVAFPSRGDEVSQDTEDTKSAGFAD